MNTSSGVIAIQENYFIIRPTKRKSFELRRQIDFTKLREELGERLRTYIDEQFRLGMSEEL